LQWLPHESLNGVTRIVTFRKLAIYALWLVLITVVLLEVGLRLYFTTRVGTSILFYGTPAYRNEQKLK